MKKTLLSLAIIAITLSCKKENTVEEVKLPAPEVVEEKVETGNPEEVKVDEGGEFKMLGLKYGYADLEPNIDAKTMEIHYSKHHLGYANKLNAEVANTDLKAKTIEEILSKLDANNAALRNNAGGYYNHNLFFDILKPEGGKPSDIFNEAVTQQFTSVDSLKTLLTDAASKRFGSGWAWLVVTKDKKLAVTSTANQDNPLMKFAEVKGTPILGIDVWEHAYYLKYQNKRGEYLTNIFNVIDWENVSKRYEDAIK